MLIGSKPPIATVYKSNLTDTDKMFFKQLSFGNKNADGTWSNEYWTGVSNSEEFKNLKDGTRVQIDFANVSNGSYKDKDGKWVNGRPQIRVIQYTVLGDAKATTDAPAEAVDAEVEDDLAW